MDTFMHKSVAKIRPHSESHSVCVMVGTEEQLPSAVMPSVSEAADSSAVSLLLELSSPATVQIRPY